MQKNTSLASSISCLKEEERKKLLKGLSDEQAEALLYDWHFWARPNQLPPKEFLNFTKTTWLILAGRGYGKTRTGAEWVIEQAKKYPGSRGGLIAPTAADARDVMIEGESGIVAISSPDFPVLYEPSKRRLTWNNGSMATLYTADEPRNLRGPQHHYIWADEICAWRYEETWDLAAFGNRLGKNPQSVVTTTPKPIKLLKEIIADKNTVITRGTTYDNAENLPASFFEKIIAKYEGTRLGRQELNAEILDDNPNALWNRQQIENLRVTSFPQLSRIVVGVDPQGVADGAETGIIVAGKSINNEIYILEDATAKGTPHTWGSAAVTAYNKNKADRIIGETNNGGDMVESTIKTVDDRVSFKKVHASRGKFTRAEPVSALYEQGKVHHVGTFPQLEDQMVEWEQGMESPDRMDALVWAITELMGGKSFGKLKLDNESMARISPNF